MRQSGIVAGLAALSALIAPHERANHPVSPKPKIKNNKIMRRRKKWWNEGKPNSGRDHKKCFLKGIRP